MAKLITEVLLKDGTDETVFVNDVTSNDEVELKNILPNTSNLVVLKVEEEYLDTLKSHSSVLNAEFSAACDVSVTYPSIPSTYTISDKSIGGSTNYTSIAGTKYLSFQHYLDTDIIPDSSDRTVNGVTGNNVGAHYFYSSPYGQRDQIRYYGSEPSSSVGTFGSDQTFFTTYTGKNVDIVAFESEIDSLGGSYAGLHDSHPDFRDPDNLSNTRCIPMNWSGLSHSSNNQITPNTMLDSHTTNTMSALGGIYCGFAKRSSLRVVYTASGVDTTSECLDAVRAWHNSKSVNSDTGYKNPTILVFEWQHTAEAKDSCIRIDQIDSVTDTVLGTTNQPGGGWGSDLTPFVSRGMIPFQLLDPIDSTWHWVIPMAKQTQATYLGSIEQCWDAGITVILSGGNNGGIYVKDDDARWNGNYVTISGTKYVYNVTKNGSGDQNDPCQISRALTNNANWYTHRAYGPHGKAKSIHVAAAANSTGCPTLDFYTSRGPGVDLLGRGSATWVAGDNSVSTYADGNKWDYYGGNSSDVPTVAGKAACYIEKHLHLHGSYPTPDQVKNALISESKPSALSVKTVNWASVPTASNTDIKPSQDRSTQPSLKIGGTAPNGGWRFGDLTGTPNRQAFVNIQNYNREQTYKKRPTSGVLFPRPRKYDIAPVEEAAT